MKVSVVIPIYKVEKYLRKCLDSVINQDLDDYEIICVDDKSPDNCLDIIKEYQKKNNKIRLVCNEINVGLSSSRNNGLDVAKGEYILFVDSDDYIKQNCLGFLYNRMKEEQLDILYFNKKSFADDSCKLSVKKIYNKRFGEKEITTGIEMFTKFMLDWSFKSMNAYTQFFRLDFLRKNNLRFYDGLVHEDYLFYFLCAMKANRVGNLDRTFYYYRVRDNSITGVVTPQRKQSMFITLSEVINFWKNHEFSVEENIAIENFCTVIQRGCEEYKLKTNGRDELPMSDNADKFLYQHFMNAKYVYITDRDWNRIKKSKRVWIYGAGKVANELVRMIIDRDIVINGILVTSEDNELFYGWKKTIIDDVSFSDDDLIIVATAGKYKKQMVEKLKKIGHKKYICAAKKLQK